MTNIHKSLSQLRVPIDSLVALERNPRHGDVDAIVASYYEFGQVKPIVARRNDDGTATVIAGNHQLLAAKKLGWDEIACIFFDGNESRALAFAIADNKTVELGRTDDSILSEILLEISDEFSELFAGLGWDEFDMAAMHEISSIEESTLATSTTFTPPEMIRTTNEAKKSVGDINSDGDLEANDDVPHEELAARGSTVATGSKSANAIVQYTIVFDNIEQQSRWYNFVRWLRNDPGIDGNTTSERLINFIDEHCEA